MDRPDRVDRRDGLALSTGALGVATDRVRMLVSAHGVHRDLGQHLDVDHGIRRSRSLVRWFHGDGLDQALICPTRADRTPAPPMVDRACRLQCGELRLASDVVRLSPCDVECGPDVALPFLLRPGPRHGLDPLHRLVWQIGPPTGRSVRTERDVPPGAWTVRDRARTIGWSRGRDAPVDCREMESTLPVFTSLTIVLPAYNEADRIGPALDELFGYLAGAEARAALPPRIRALIVDDGSTDATAHLVLDRPEAAAPEDAPVRLELLRVPHGGKGGAVRAGMLAATGDLVIFADADMATPPDQLPQADCRSRRGRCRPRQPDPAGRLRHAGHATGVPAGPREGLPRPRRGLGHGPREGHPVRFQGLSTRGRPRDLQPRRR